MTARLKLLFVKTIFIFSVSLQVLYAQQTNTLTHYSDNKNLNTQKTDSVISDKNYLNSIDIGPNGDIYFIHYCRILSPKNEFNFGFSYYNPSILNLLEYPGVLQSFTLEFGLRRYLWRNLYVEIQLDPQITNCNDTITGKTYSKFGLVSEIRLGYRFDFKISKIPCYINIPFFAGYHLINPLPQSFREVDKNEGIDKFYISPIPMLLIGIRF